MRRERDPRYVFGGSKSKHHFSIVVFFSRSNERASVESLDALFEQTGAGSIKQALESNAALAALVEEGAVTRISGEELTEYSGVEYITSSVDFEGVF